MNQTQKPLLENTPWWRLPIVWMVISGPAIVVVAAIFTAGIAFTHVDPVLDTSIGHVKGIIDMPALQARNHAANADAHAPAEK
jgi:hypothetical protein